MRFFMSVFLSAAMLTSGAARAQETVAKPETTRSEPVAAEAATSAPVEPIQAATPAADPENTLALDLSTGGRALIRLRPEAAPTHVERIKTLARQGFYNGVTFHRVIDGFMAQTGDPSGTGEGGSQLPDINAEFNRLPHVRGAVSMARTNEPNSANSQFFVMLAPRLTLDGNYSVFGRVIEGMEYIDSVPRGEPPAAPARIIRASVQADNVLPPSAAEIAAANRPPLTPPTSAAAAIDAALAADGAPAGAPVEPAQGSSLPEGAGPAESTPAAALEATAESENAARNDTGTAADPTAMPAEPAGQQPLMPEPDEAAAPQ